MTTYQDWDGKVYWNGRSLENTRMGSGAVALGIGAFSLYETLQDLIPTTIGNLAYLAVSAAVIGIGRRTICSGLEGHQRINVLEEKLGRKATGREISTHMKF